VLVTFEDCAERVAVTGGRAVEESDVEFVRGGHYRSDGAERRVV
jgi:hypothetical protein